MWACFKIINNYFWKSLFGPGVLFVFSILYMFVISSCWTLLGQIKSIAVIPTAYSFIVVLNGIFCIPITINSLRSSIIMKRLGNSKITSLQFISVLTIFYFVMVLISMCWMMLWTYVFYLGNLNDFNTLISSANMGEVFYSTIITFLLALSIGMLILTFATRNFTISIVAAIIMIFSLIFAGFGVPVQMLHIRWSDGVHSPLWGWIYVDPFWYTSSMTYESWFSTSSDYFNQYGSQIFNISSSLYAKTIDSQVTCGIILDSTDKALNIFFPISLFIGFSIIDCFTFKWNIR